MAIRAHAIIPTVFCHFFICEYIHSKRGIYEADTAICPLPTAKAVGYASTAPTGLTLFF